MKLSTLIIIILFSQSVYAFSLSGTVYDAHQTRLGNVSIVISDEMSASETVASITNS